MLKYFFEHSNVKGDMVMADSKSKAAVKQEEKVVDAKVEKKTTGVKTAPVKKVTPAAKKEETKKAEAKKAEAKAVVNFQFAGKSYTTEDLVKIAKDVWVYDLNKDLSEFQSLELYVKPEESTAYYVVNEEITGSFGI